jgi:type VI secretion system FHA domain protein
MEAMVPEVSLRSGVQLLDEEELADRHDFARILASDTPAPISAKPQKAKSRRPLIERPQPKPAADPAFSAEFATDLSPTTLEVTANDLFDSFLDGLGLSRADLPDGAESAEVLQNAGAVFRAFVEGCVQMLASRRNLKAAFKLDQTMALPRHNNPLKLSEDVSVLLRQLLTGHEGEYLGPVEAAREVCRDLLYHQQAVVDAMQAAFAEFSERFDPDELVAAFHREGGAASRFSFVARLKYWQMYCDRYPLLTEKSANRIPQAVSDDYVRAYERQIAEYKRLEVVPDLKSTVRWRPPAPADVPAVAHANRDANEHAAADADLIPSIEFDDTFTDLFDDDVVSG